MRILAVSYLFPNRVYPNHGIFVLKRLKAVQKYCEVKVINPIPWFPFSSKFKRYANYHRIPKQDVLEGIEVFHPRFFIIPRYLKSLDFFTFAASVLPLALYLKKAYPYDIIDVHWTYPDLLSGRILASLTRKPQMVTVRGKEALNLFLKETKHSEFLPYAPEASLRSLLVKRLLVRSDQVVTLSQELRELCVSFGADPQKVKKIPNGVDTSVFLLQSKQSCRSKLGIPFSQTMIVSVGSLIYGKGFDRIINAFPKLQKIYNDLSLYILGSEGPAGFFKDKLIQMVSKYELKNHVHFVGEVENHNLPLWYNAADVFCLASRSEGSPNVLMEALTCGCPCVATDVGSVREIMDEGRMGVIIKNNEESLYSGLWHALSTVYDRKNIADAMRQYSWDWCAQKVIEVYRKQIFSR